MIDREFVAELRCPVCRAPITLHEDRGVLKCGQCHRVYPIRDDIPVLLEDEATIENP